MDKAPVFMGRYESKSLLGEGGMGRVYLAYDQNLKRSVVVKVMHEHIATDPKFRERFEEEKFRTAQFEHTYSVRVYDAGYDEIEGPCIIMELIRGKTLEQLLEENKGRLSPGRVGRLLFQLCEVLQAAHELGIVHRDLKPANIMVIEPDTPKEKIKVMDFGLAKLSGPQSLKRMVDSNGEFAVGTPTYMCPEQVRGEEMDHRGDLYSVGVILYELLTGCLPFTGPEAMDVLLAHATEPPPSFADVGAADLVPRAIEKVVLSCLAKEKDDRPSSAQALAERFKQALERGDAPSDSDPELNELPQEPSAEETATPAAPAADPNAITHHFEAWMPETIAAYKLRGFVHDAGGDLIESVPGRVRVHLGRPGTVYTAKGGPLSWIGIGRRSSLIEMDLLMAPAAPERKGLLRMTVVMRSLAGGDGPNNAAFRARCHKIFIDLRGYLMGQGASVKS